jgi:hypothetical protein
MQTSQKHFHNGAGLFIAPLLEYRPADSRWVGYKLVTIAKGDFDQVILHVTVLLIYQLT